MVKFTMRYFALFPLFLALTGCGTIFDDPTPQDQTSAYLAVTLRAAHTDGQESINKDKVDYEDRVHNLAMVVFDSGSGRKIGEYFTTTLSEGIAAYAFTVKMPSGTRDFYFVANLTSSMQTDLASIADRTAMDNFMQSLRELHPDHYLNASADRGFPMARVYPAQNITTGGTVYTPVTFKPVAGGSTEDYVKLIRVVAKLEVQFVPADKDKIEKVELVNANKYYRLLSDPAMAEPDAFAADIPLRKIGTSGDTWLAYMPEAFVENATVWTNTGNNRPINYFRITTKGGAAYDIPIITHDGAIPGGAYLPFARATLAGNKPDYTIYRNHHYKYVISNLPNKIEIIYSISDWNVVGKVAYLGYGYSVEVDDEGNITIRNTILNCDPHLVRLIATNGAYFGTNPSDTSAEFSQLLAGASQTFKVNKDAVPAGATYLELYYNKSPGAGVIPDKEFRK